MNKLLKVQLITLSLLITGGLQAVKPRIGFQDPFKSLPADLQRMILSMSAETDYGIDLDALAKGILNLRLTNQAAKKAMDTPENIINIFKSLPIMQQPLL